MADRLKIGIVGAGAAARWYYLPATRHWDDRLQLTAVCDVDEARAKQFTDEYGGAPYGDYETMLRWADIDAVAVLTPHTLHMEQVITALQAGKHVLVEKPMTERFEDAQRVVELAEEKALHVSCAPPNMLHPGQRRLMEIVSKGVIGKINLIKISQSSMGPGSRPGAPTDFSWFYTAGAGGMSSMAGYGLVRLTGLLGGVKSLSAMATTSIPERVMRDGPARGTTITADVPDNNVIVFDMGDDTLGTMDTGYVVMGTEAPSMSLFGSEGTIEVYGGDQVLRMRLYRDDWDTNVDGWQDVDIPGLDSRWAMHPATLLSLADAVLDGKPLLNGPRQLAHVIEFIEKVWVSAESGERVNLTSDYTPPPWDALPMEVREDRFGLA
ncbi:MAG: Gfo/Idh/MocA family oxidoreductase [Chloroflexi bacterium]|nr:Gfo/Idh/MocA family oxidoreductase [Chloroflexota bacterium]MCH8818595.1 Gfo/Idh/MocA family oxidoreductase [Chloroflexota bacterium]